MGHTEPLVASQSSIVAFSKHTPDVIARTGSFITCPLTAHKNSLGIVGSALDLASSLPDTDCYKMNDNSNDIWYVNIGNKQLSK